LNINHIVIVGAGTMGTDLAVNLSKSGARVTIVGRPGGRAETFGDRATSAARDLDVTLENLDLQLVSDLRSADWSSTDLVIENVAEDLAVKQDIFKQIVSLANERTVITSNSSTFGISSIADGLSQQSRVFWTTFFYASAFNSASRDRNVGEL
jgi:3-hydroxybutyryl-CoA dehydrogenase